METKKCTMAGAAPAADDPVQSGYVLGREEILGAADTVIERVSVPEWGGDVCVRTIMAGDWDTFEASLVTIIDGTKQKADLTNYRAKFAAMVICDAEGDPLFSADDIPALARKSRAALDRVIQAGERLNMVSAEARAEIVDHLKPTPDGVS